MTRLILEPGSLSSLYPDASVSQNYRVRIIAQVLEYHPDNATLTLIQVPTLNSSDSSTITINIFEQLGDISGDVIRKGTVVNLEGFYDGNTVIVIDIYPINGAHLNVENLETIQSLNNLPSFYHDSGSRPNAR
ncbi:uncharacterized protein SPAPADRAFT_142548 [Spathaspora passalidarum NRRL Y-27907]|uniref:Uncharacterized protein n=1 Tax=Spathaspora passalidarum (strain NRRL Y-27907 / 11-Y1) TaxID=619300 RepID=G3ASQ9_SPAPN|nr:uncharacterized protein SPAPADRAFT_142548 [Spathaspora passalidarum NRRL Y-27907]EGW31123.1 hypothetical protein SPAPADRAFT_142548 [Spathaspora passalidarum NRRL Y-27907]